MQSLFFLCREIDGVTGAIVVHEMPDLGEKLTVLALLQGMIFEDQFDVVLQFQNIVGTCAGLHGGKCFLLKTACLDIYGV